MMSAMNETGLWHPPTMLVLSQGKSWHIEANMDFSVAVEDEWYGILIDIAA
jgi:hypothetical protein